MMMICSLSYCDHSLSICYVWRSMHECVRYSRPNGWADRDQTLHTNQVYQASQGQGQSAVGVIMEVL